MSDWRDLTSYKKCRRKRYTCYVCMPDINYYIIGLNDGSNVFIHKSDIGHSNYKEYFKELYNLGRVRTVDSSHPFVVCDVLGRYQLYTPQMLAMEFNFIINDKECPINNNTLISLMTGNKLDWRAIISRPIPINIFANHIDYKIKDVVKCMSGEKRLNMFKNYSGSGDFVVSYSNTNVPDSSRIDLISGVAFSKMFDIRGWESCIDTNRMKKSYIDFKSLPNISGVLDVRKYSEDVLKYVRGLLLGNNSRYIFLYNNTDDTDNDNYETRVNEFICIEDLDIDSNTFKLKINTVRLCFDMSKDSVGLINLASYKRDRINFKLSAYKSTIDAMFKKYYYIMSTINRGYRLKFSSVRMSNNVYNALKFYSNDLGYPIINESMRTKKVIRDLSIRHIASIKYIYDYLKHCTINDCFLIRGISDLDDDYEVGDIVKCDSFTSTSLSFNSALKFAEFGGNIFIVRAKKINGFYLNSVSYFRDKEFEVLLSPDYSLKIRGIKYCTSYTVYLCDIVEDKYDLSWLSIKETNLNLEELYTNILNNTDASKYKLSVSDSDIMLTLDNRLIFTISNNKIQLKYNNKNSNPVDEFSSYDDCINYLWGYLEEKRDALKDYELGNLNYNLFVCFMSCFIDVLTNNGFLLLNVDYTDLGTNDTEVKRFKGRVHTVGDNDDSIVFRFKSKDKKVKITARTKDKEVDDIISIDVDNLETINLPILNIIYNKLELNPMRRVEKCLNLIAHYFSNFGSLEVINDVGHGERSYKYSNYDTWYIHAKVDSNTLVFSIIQGGQVIEGKTFDFFDSLINMASELHIVMRDKNLL